MAEPTLKYSRYRGGLSPLLLPQPSSSSASSPGSSSSETITKKVTSSAMAPNAKFVVIGFSDGSVSIIDTKGEALIKPLEVVPSRTSTDDKMTINTQNEMNSSNKKEGGNLNGNLDGSVPKGGYSPTSVVSVSLDATATTLFAITSAGMGKVFSLNISASSDYMLYDSTPISSTTVKYPNSTVNCAVIDPAYNQKSERCVVVGTAEGTVIITKRGWLGRRDSTLYQGLHSTLTDQNKQQKRPRSSSSSTSGILSLSWRGDYLAFCDFSGVKIIDVTTGKR